MRLDLLLRNARVVTGVAARPRASTIGIWAGRVVGLDGDVDGLAARRTVDLAGAAVVPGFHDAHCHTTSYGLGLVQLDLRGAAGRDAVLDAVREHADGLPAGAWVVGTGYRGRPGAHVRADELDRAAGGRPVWLTHLSGHLCVVSTAVLARTGITGPLPAGARGRVDVDADGRPSGLLEETAMDVVKDHVGPSSLEQLADAVDRATRGYAAEGITGFTEAGIGSRGVDHSPLEVAAYQRARDTGRLHCRAQLMVHDEVLHPVGGGPADGVTAGLDLGMRTGFGDDRLALAAMKVWVDGSGTATAPGFDDDEKVLRDSIIAGARAGWQVAAHAMGDAAADLVLDALDSAGAQAVRGRRHRIEHGGLIRADQVPRLAGLGMCVVPQPVFVTDFGDGFSRRLGGGGRDHESFRVASLLAAGVAVAASSDRPVAAGSPLRGIQAMVERLTSGGRLYGGDERVDAATALAAWTSGGAWAAHSEQRWGRLAPGLLADLVVLAEDPTTAPTEAIGDIAVLATLVEGAATHDPQGLTGA